MLELLKIIVQPVLLERDEDGGIVGEKIGEAVSIYSEDKLVEFVQALKDEVAKQNGNL